MTIFLIVMLVILAITLITVIYMQSGKVRNIGASIVGTENMELFQNQKTRGSERVLAWITGICVAFFIILAVVARIS